jgi:preflagellin peptidase FlaK
MLTISSYEDFKTREVDDRIWLIFSPIGIIITFIEYFLNYIDFSYLIFYVLSIIIVIIIYYSELVGGADSKELISISFLDPINYNKNTIHPFTPIIILTNSCIISLIILLFLFIYNLYRILNKENIFKIKFIEDKDVWVVPSLPSIVFILFGYIISILYGDILKIFFKFQF